MSELQEFVRAVEEWRSGGSKSSTKQKVADLVSSLEEEYALQARQLQMQHAVAVDELSKVLDLVYHLATYPHYLILTGASTKRIRLEP